MSGQPRYARPGETAMYSGGSGATGYGDASTPITDPKTKTPMTPDPRGPVAPMGSSSSGGPDAGGTPFGGPGANDRGIDTPQRPSAPQPARTGARRRRLANDTAGMAGTSLLARRY